MAESIARHELNSLVTLEELMAAVHTMRTDFESRTDFVTLMLPSHEDLGRLLEKETAALQSELEQQLTDEKDKRATVADDVTEMTIVEIEEDEEKAAGKQEEQVEVKKTEEKKPTGESDEEQYRKAAEEHKERLQIVAALMRLTEMVTEMQKVVSTDSFQQVLKRTFDTAFTELRETLGPTFAAHDKLPFAKTVQPMRSAYASLLPETVASDSSPLFKRVALCEELHDYCSIVYYPFEPTGGPLMDDPDAPPAGAGGPEPNMDELQALLGALGGGVGDGGVGPDGEPTLQGLHALLGLSGMGDTP